MGLLTTLVLLALLAFLAPPAGSGLPALRRGTPFAPLLVATLLAYVTMCIGSYVSSSGAGLACTTFPACDGTLTGTTTAQLAQMLHRFAAGAFTLAALAAAGLAAGSRMPRVRAWTFAGTVLALAQVALGIANVVWRLPTPLREAHAGNAAVTFLAFVVATCLVTLDPLPAAHALDTGLSVTRAV